MSYDGPERRRDPERMVPDGASVYQQATNSIVSSLKMLRRLIVDQHIERAQGVASVGGGDRDGRKSP